jgi:formate dehydrogenase subunit gamma
MINENPFVLKGLGERMDEPVAWDEARAAAIIAAHPPRQDALLPMLHALQAQFGCVPDAATPLLAQALNISRAEVHGVISFYHDFRHAPAGRHTLRLCQAEACQAMGGRELAQRLLDRLGIAWGGTTADRGLTVEPVYCLGLCACAPAGLLDGAEIGRLSDASLAEALADAQRGDTRV